MTEHNRDLLYVQGGTQEIDKADVLAIGMSKAQDLITNKIRKNIKTLRDKKESADKSMHSVLESSKTAWIKKAAPLVKILKPACKELTTRVEYFGIDMNKNTVGVNVTISARHDSQYMNGMHGSVNIRSQEVIPAAYVKANNEVSALLKEILVVEEELVNWLSREQDIPSLERKLRGKLAADKLKKSKQGEEILKLMEVDIEKEILLLG